MKTLIKTDKRIVTHIITGTPPDEYDALFNLFKEQGLHFDGLLIECNSRKAYLWEKYKPVVMNPDPPRAITA